MKYILIAIPILLVGIFVYFQLKEQDLPIDNPQPTITNGTNTSQDAPVDFTATFDITTNGTVRTFTNPDYHNQSESVYIEATNTNTLIVKSANTTWDDFFRTLPFSLSKDCLTTGTGQTFCTNENQTLKFFINGVENPDALDEIINPNDRLEVIFE